MSSSLLSLMASMQASSRAGSGEPLWSSARMRLQSTRLASSWFLMLWTNTLAPVRATSNFRSRATSSRSEEKLSWV